LPPLQKLRDHPQFKSTRRIADTAFHRVELMEPARLIPDEWVEDTCALESIDYCVSQLQRFSDARADEIATYASTPGPTRCVARGPRSCDVMTAIIDTPDDVTPEWITDALRGGCVLEAAARSYRGRPARRLSQEAC
jgi:hypothetical protein